MSDGLSNGAAYTSAALLRTVGTFKDIVHTTYCPEDHIMIQNNLVEYAELLLNVVSSSVGSLLRRVVENVQKLESEVESIEAAYRLEKQKKGTKQATPLPGHESRYDLSSSDVVDSIRHQRHSLTRLLSTIMNSHTDVIIYDTKFNMPLLIQSQITAELQRLLRSQASTCSFTKSYQALKALKTFIQQITIPSLQEALTETIKEECCPSATSDKASYKEACFADLCIKEFITNVEGMPPKKKGNNGFIISKAHEACFIPIDASPYDSPYRLVMDATELSCLVKIIGLGGTSLLSKSLDKTVKASIASLKVALEKNCLEDIFFPV